MAISTVNPAHQFTDFVIKLHPHRCVIDKDSELYHKLSDTVSWVMLKIMGNNDDGLSQVWMDQQLRPENFVELIKTTLEQELLTNVEFLKVETYKNYDISYDISTLQVGVAITLDQRYIDHYEDIVDQQLLDAAFRDLQIKLQVTAIRPLDYLTINGLC